MEVAKCYPKHSVFARGLFILPVMGIFPSGRHWNRPGLSCFHLCKRFAFHILPNHFVHASKGWQPPLPRFPEKDEQHLKSSRRRLRGPDSRFATGNGVCEYSCNHKPRFWQRGHAIPFLPSMRSHRPKLFKPQGKRILSRLAV